jgi:hypothetical protein
LYCSNLPTPQLSSTNLHRRRRREPAVGSLIGAEETPSHKVLTSRDSHQPRKAGSSPIRNIGRRSPPSFFNTGSRASATTPFRRAGSPHHLLQTHSSQARRTLRAAYPRRHVMAQRQIEATPTAWAPQTSRRRQRRLDHYSN